MNTGLTLRDSPVMAAVRLLAGAIAVLIGAAACTPALQTAAGGEDEPDRRNAWEAAVQPADADRLERLDGAWRRALAQAREAGHGSELAALGTLVDSSAALPNPAPPPGRYRCRTVKLGSQSGLLHFVAYGWFTCEITRQPDGSIRLDKLTGSQRQHGSLYPDSEDRLVFLGALALGDQEGMAPPYAADRERDVVGVLERIGPERWRLVQPWPTFESVLDLLELVPGGQR